MTDTRDTIPSVAERVRAVNAGAPVVAAHFLKETAAFALGEETVLLVGADGEPRRVEAHTGAILATDCDGERVITGGDDGKIIAIAADGERTVLGTDAKHRWIDHVALGPGGTAAWSAGKQAFVRTGKGAERTLDLPSTVGGVAFAPKGLRLAVAHYNGVTLWFPNAETAPEHFEWKGSHLGVTFSPDGRFLVTTMQEPTLHGWRIADRKDMRMSGYSARVRSLAWTAGGKSLATSGSNQLILWPFAAKDGPMGKTPHIVAPSEAQAEAVACHPKQEIAAVGYGDGMVLIVRLEDGAEVLARKPGGAPVTALAWSASGNALAFGTEDGEAGVISVG
jgi:WD40 repeat protein